MEKLRKKIDIYIDRLEKLGIDYLTKKEEVWAYIIMGIIHLSLLVILFFVIPLKAVSIPLISIITIGSVLFIWLDYIDELDDYNDNMIIFYLSGVIVIIALITYFAMLKTLPYKGKDPNLIRRRKLKMLIRKAKINKLKFWK